MNRIYVANLGAYNRGCLVGKWIDLPSDDIMGEIQSMLESDESIASRNFSEEDEEWAIHDYELDIKGYKVSEYEDVEALNDLIGEFDSLSLYEQNKVQAILEIWGGELEDAINNVDDYNLYEDIEEDEDLGRYWVEESGAYDLSAMGNLANYFDYEAFGRDIRFETDGGFSEWGWIEKC